MYVCTVGTRYCQDLWHVNTHKAKKQSLCIHLLRVTWSHLPSETLSYYALHSGLKSQCWQILLGVCLTSEDVVPYLTFHQHVRM